MARNFQTYFLDHSMRTNVLKWVNSFEVTGLGFLARAGLIKKCDPCSGKKRSILTHGTDTLSFPLKRSVPVNIFSPVSRQKKSQFSAHFVPLWSYCCCQRDVMHWAVKVTSVQSVAGIPHGILTGEEEEEEKQQWMEGRLQTARFDWIGTISGVFVYFFNSSYFCPGNQQQHPALNRISL